MGKSKNNWDYLVDQYGNYLPVLGQGATGGIGPVGPKGDVGPAGVQGPQGIQGVQGVQGPITTGAFIFKGNVPNAAALPTTGNVVGDSYVQQDTNELVVWDGSAFTGQGTANTTVAKGEPGVQGQKGEPSTVAGPKGDKGDKGDKGQKGQLPLISSLPTLP